MKMTWAGDVVHWIDEKNVNKFVRKSEGKTSLGRLRCRWILRKFDKRVCTILGQAPESDFKGAISRVYSTKLVETAKIPNFILGVFSDIFTPRLCHILNPAGGFTHYGNKLLLCLI
jgi:hypothetical protein